MVAKSAKRNRKSDSNNKQEENKAALAVVETDDDTVSEDTDTEETEDENTFEPNNAGQKKKSRRTLDPTDVVINYMQGGVSGIEKFAAENDRKITAGPIEKALNMAKLTTPKGEYDAKFGELDAFLAKIKADPGSGKGKKATYNVDGKLYGFTVQRPKYKKTGRVGNPQVVTPLKAMEMKSGQDTCWLAFIDSDAVLVLKKKPKGDFVIRWDDEKKAFKIEK